MRRRTHPHDGLEAKGGESRGGPGRSRHGAGDDPAAGARERPASRRHRRHPRDNPVRRVWPPHPLPRHLQWPCRRRSGDHRDHPAVDENRGGADGEAAAPRHAAGDDIDSSRRAQAGDRAADRPHQSRPEAPRGAAASPGRSLRRCEAGTRRGGGRLPRPRRSRQGGPHDLQARGVADSRRDPAPGQGGAGPTRAGDAGGIPRRRRRRRNPRGRPRGSRRLSRTPRPGDEPDGRPAVADRRARRSRPRGGRRGCR